MPDFLFVCGCPRSGTTLLANTLNAHPRIGIGIERYGNRFFKNALTPDLFEESRFYDIRPGDTFYDTLDFAPIYNQKREGFSQLKFVGDKIPLLFDHFAEFATNFPSAKFVFCLRNIIDVAASYEVRARNPDDTTWNSEKGVTAAIDEWGRSLKAYHDYRDKVDIALFDYDRFGQDGDAQISGLTSWLGLDYSRPIRRRVELAHERSAKIAEQRQQPLDGAMKKQILMTAELPLYRQAIRTAGQSHKRRAANVTRQPKTRG